MSTANESGGALSTGSIQGFPGFRDPERLTRWLKILLYVSIAADVAGLISDLLEFRLLNEIKNASTMSPSLTAAADASDSRQQILGIIRLALLVVTGVCFLVWIHRANANVRALGAQGMTFSPGWSVGWYFIPIANMWKPYQAMKEIWRASANPTRWQDEARGGLLPWWWALFLSSNILGNISFRLRMSARSVDDFMSSTAFGVASDAIGVVLGFVAIALVTAIFNMQVAQASPRG
jgi:hypothetical protein